jgi:hypothetical protein
MTISVIKGFRIPAFAILPLAGVISEFDSGSRKLAFSAFTSSVIVLLNCRQAWGFGRF